MVIAGPNLTVPTMRAGRKVATDGDRRTSIVGVVAAVGRLRVRNTWAKTASVIEPIAVAPGRRAVVAAGGDQHGLRMPARAISMHQT
jgi:hypothetical protein